MCVPFYITEIWQSRGKVHLIHVRLILCWLLVNFNKTEKEQMASNICLIGLNWDHKKISFTIDFV